MRSFPSVVLFCSTLCCAGMLAGAASAQSAPVAPPSAATSPSPEDADARRAFEAGRDAYDHGAFAAALGHYERAYALSPRPGLLFNIGRAADSDGQATRARIAYEAYLAAVPAAENADFVRARLAKVRETEAAQSAAAPSASIAPPASPPSAPEPAPSAPAAPDAAPTAAPAPAALPSVAATTPPEASRAEPPLLANAQRRENDDTPPPSRRKRALLWTALGVVVAGGVTGGAIALSRGHGAERSAGDGYALVPEAR